MEEGALLAKQAGKGAQNKSNAYTKYLGVNNGGALYRETDDKNEGGAVKCHALDVTVKEAGNSKETSCMTSSA